MEGFNSNENPTGRRFILIVDRTQLLPLKGPIKDFYRVVFGHF
jgi:hypothetical protein